MVLPKVSFRSRSNVYIHSVYVSLLCIRVGGAHESSDGAGPLVNF